MWGTVGQKITGSGTGLAAAILVTFSTDGKVESIPVYGVVAFAFVALGLAYLTLTIREEQRRRSASQSVTAATAPVAVTQSLAAATQSAPASLGGGIHATNSTVTVASPQQNVGSTPTSAVPSYRATANVIRAELEEASARVLPALESGEFWKTGYRFSDYRWGPGQPYRDIVAEQAVDIDKPISDAYAAINRCNQHLQHRFAMLAVEEYGYTLLDDDRAELQAVADALPPAFDALQELGKQSSIGIEWL